MEELLKTLVATSPGLVSTIIIVILFMKHLEKREENYRLLHTEHLDERKQCRITVEANANALRATATEMQKNIFTTDRNTEALNNLAHVIKEKV